MKGYLFKTHPEKMAQYQADAKARGRNFREHIEDGLEAMRPKTTLKSEQVHATSGNIPPGPVGNIGQKKQVKPDFKGGSK